MPRDGEDFYGEGDGGYGELKKSELVYDLPEPDADVPSGDGDGGDDDDDGGSSGGEDSSGADQ